MSGFERLLHHERARSMATGYLVYSLASFFSFLDEVLKAGAADHSNYRRILRVSVASILPRYCDFVIDYHCNVLKAVGQ